MKKLLLTVVFCLFWVAVAAADEYPRGIAAGCYSFLREGQVEGEGGLNIPKGWAAEFSVNANKYFGFTGSLSGHYKSVTVEEVTADANVYFFLFGPQFNFRKEDKVNVFFRPLFGVGRASASGAINDDFSLTASSAKFAFSFGGGVDAGVSKHVAIRVFQYDWIRISGTNEHRLGFGLVFKFGND